MPEQDELLIKRDGPIAVLTLNRPHRNNALTDGMLVKLGRTVLELQDDGTTRAVMLTGAGDVFCAGFDLGGGGSGPARKRLEYQDHADLASETLWRIWRSPLPFIACVRKACIGGAVYLTGVCDFVVTTPDTRFAMSELKLGMSPPLFNIFPWLMTYRAAKEFLMTGDPIDGRRAVEWGLATRCVEEEDPTASALALTRQLAAMPDDVAARMKRSVNRRWELAGLVAGIEEDVVGFVDDKANMGPAQKAFRQLSREVGFKEAMVRLGIDLGRTPRR